MSPYVEIPGIIQVTVNIDYSRWTQFSQIVYTHLRETGRMNKQSSFINRVVHRAIDLAIQEMIDNAILLVKPKTMIELLQSKTDKAFSDLESKLITGKIR